MRIGIMSLGVAFCAAVVLGGAPAEANTKGKTKPATVTVATASGSAASTFQMPWQVGVFQ